MTLTPVPVRCMECRTVYEIALFEYEPPDGAESTGVCDECEPVVIARALCGC